MSPSVSPSAAPGSAYDIIVIADAEAEATAGQIVSTSGGFGTGVAGANGRVYDNSTFVSSFTYLGGQTEFVSAGCRFYFRTDATDSMLRFRRVSGQVNHMSIQRVAGGTLRVADAANAVNYDSGSANISLTTWYYCTFYCRIHNTLGEFTAKLFDASGALIETLTQAGIDTLNAGNAAEISAWGGVSGDTYIDELWTDINGQFQGCGRINARSPNGAGASAQWSRGGTDTGNNWDQVNALPTLVSGNPSHVFATAVDQIDLYEFEDISISGPVISVRQIMAGRARSGTGRQFKAMCRISGVNYEGSQVFTSDSTSNQAPMIEDWKNDPSTGDAWADAAAINAAQFGYKSVTDEILVINTSIHVLIDIS